MAVHAIEWRISQCLEIVDKTNWDRVYGPRYVNGLCDFCAYFHVVYIHGLF